MLCRSLYESQILIWTREWCQKRWSMQLSILGLEKPSLDKGTPSSYRHVSNLTKLSKVIEKEVVLRIIYLNSKWLSAFSRCIRKMSTKTTLPSKQQWTKTRNRLASRWFQFRFQSTMASWLGDFVFDMAVLAKNTGLGDIISAREDAASSNPWPII